MLRPRTIPNVRRSISLTLALIVVSGCNAIAVGPFDRSSGQAGMHIFFENLTDAQASMTTTDAGVQTGISFVQSCEATLEVGTFWVGIGFEINGEPVWHFDEMPDEHHRHMKITLQPDGDVVITSPASVEFLPLNDRCNRQ